MGVFPVLPPILVYLDCLLPLLNVPRGASLFIVTLLVDAQGSTSTDCLFTNFIVARFLSFKRLLLSVVSPCVNLEVGLLLRHLVTFVARALSVVS